MAAVSLNRGRLAASKRMASTGSEERRKSQAPPADNLAIALAIGSGSRSKPSSSGHIRSSTSAGEIRPRLGVVPLDRKHKTARSQDMAVGEADRRGTICFAFPLRERIGPVTSGASIASRCAAVGQPQIFRRGAN